ncbi:MAG: trigger factor [Micrococcales bacterium]|nr:trigger factor [Microbacteriaceae bacterium]NBR23181.1 trigger factor [Micrococcales bacterium]NBS85419.1 trigger factor [Micrococcales bacterium]
MKTVVERLTPTRVKLTIEVNPEDFKPSLDHAYEHISETVNIPGFRKGKIPAAILDQRVGRGAILAHAINDGLDSIYRKAIEQEKLRPLGQPSADVKSTPDEKTFAGDLVVEIEVEVRPEIKLPEFKGLKVTVDTIKVEKDEVEAELDRLRSRFGTLITVERPAKKGDFTSIDLTASVDGVQIDQAQNISYEIGSDSLLDGIDDALDTLTAGETTTFKSKLVGGDKAGQEAEITVTLNAVKERELPAIDDAWAQMASEFDTVKELRSSIEDQIKRSKSYTQGLQARELLTEQLLTLVDVPVSEELINADVERHLESEGKASDDPHREEVLVESTKSFQVQMLLDAIAEAEQVKVNENELLQYLIQASQSYGMEPNEFVKVVDEQGQIPSFVAEVARRKALSVVLEAAAVTDSDGKKVDLAEFTKTDDGFAPENHEGHDHD